MTVARIESFNVATSSSEQLSTCQEKIKKFGKVICSTTSLYATGCALIASSIIYLASNSTTTYDELTWSFLSLFIFCGGMFLMIVLARCLRNERNVGIVY